MSWIQTFVDAVKKAFGKEPAVDIEEVRSTGGLGSTYDSGAFDPLRPTPTPDSGERVDADDISVKSAAPEEGGESRIQ